MILTYEQFIKHLDTRFTWSPIFKVTNLCNNNCAHCCERSGPTCPIQFIPSSDIKNILTQFKGIKNFLNVVTITGGEPTMSYYTHQEYYIPQILKHCAKSGYEAYLNTNAHWTTGPHADQIFADLSNHILKFNKHKLYFRLSQDSFHNNATESNTEFIKWFSSNKNTQQPHSGLYMFFDTPAKFQELKTNLHKKYNIRLTQIHTIAGSTIYQINKSNHVLCAMQYQGIQDMGRAHDNKISTQRPFTKTELFFAPYVDPEQEICFDASGNALLSASGNDTIKTPYYDKNGNIKTLSQIKTELFKSAYNAYLQEVYLSNIR